MLVLDLRGLTSAFVMSRPDAAGVFAQIQDCGVKPRTKEVPLHAEERFLRVSAH